jgi:hypothetical protein
VPENRKLRRTLEPKRGETVRDWRKLVMQENEKGGIYVTHG